MHQRVLHDMSEFAEVTIGPLSAADDHIVSVRAQQPPLLAQVTNLTFQPETVAALLSQPFLDRPLPSRLCKSMPMNKIRGTIWLIASVPAKCVASCGCSDVVRLATLHFQDAASNSPTLQIE